MPKLSLLKNSCGTIQPIAEWIKGFIHFSRGIIVRKWLEVVVPVRVSSINQIDVSEKLIIIGREYVKQYKWM